ncbi:hypothetical protein ScPMuIL_003202 [Solemya velum]
MERAIVERGERERECWTLLACVCGTTTSVRQKCMRGQNEKKVTINSRGVLGQRELIFRLSEYQRIRNGKVFPQDEPTGHTHIRALYLHLRSLSNMECVAPNKL